MKFTVTGHQVVVTRPQRADIQQKAQRLARILNDALLSTQVVISREGSLTVCEWTIRVKGDHQLHGKGRDRLFRPAVDAAVDRVAQQAQRLADRWKSRRKGGAV
jgi:ribosomal subunit interface protein